MYRQYVHVCKECELCAKMSKECEICAKKVNMAKQIYSVPEDVRYRTVSYLCSHLFIVNRFLFYVQVL